MWVTPSEGHEQSGMSCRRGLLKALGIKLLFLVLYEFCSRSLSLTGCCDIKAAETLAARYRAVCGLSRACWAAEGNDAPAATQTGIFGRTLHRSNNPYVLRDKFPAARVLIDVRAS